MTNKPLSLLLFSIALALIAATPTSASDAAVVNSANTVKLAEGAASPPASVADLAWLAGYWQGQGLGGRCEEMWAPPIGDRMYGTFTLRKNGDAVFSEHMVIVEHEGSLALKVKHFSGDFTAWEEKDDAVVFPLVKLGNQEAYFNGLTLRRSGPDTLDVYLVLFQDGERTEQTFNFRRVEL